MSQPDLKIFYDLMRSGTLLGPILSPAEVEGLGATLGMCASHNLRVADTSYILATEYHETGGTMHPVKELGGIGYLTRMYDIRGARQAMARANGNTTPGDGVKFCGRGKAQITWKNNYLKVGKKIGVDLVNNPDLALNMIIASQILVEGSINGWFSGRKLADTLPRVGFATEIQFVGARPIINGHDKAVMIADYALIFQTDLNKAGWPA